MWRYMDFLDTFKRNSIFRTLRIYFLELWDYVSEKNKICLLIFILPCYNLQIFFYTYEKIYISLKLQTLSSKTA